MTMIKKYKKKPVDIIPAVVYEALQFTGDADNIEALSKFIISGRSKEMKSIYDYRNNTVVIVNNVLIFSGNECEYRSRIANVGDYIIKSNTGEFYSSSSDDFEMAFEDIEE